MAQRTYKFKAGQRVHLDDVYSLMGIIPNDSYHQDDIGGSSPIHIDPTNDAGETLLFLKDVTIKINIS